MSQRPRITVTQSQRLQLNLGLQASIQLLRTDAAGLTRYLEEAAAENPALVLAPPPPPAPGEWLPRWSRIFAAPDSAADEAAAPGPSLIAHVMSAIDRRMTDPRDHRIAVALAEALEPSGWLGQDTAVIAARLKVKPREVDAVLKRLQEFDPIGLFARDLAECLALQAQEEGIYDDVMAVILRNLDLLAKGDMARLATLARVDQDQILRRFRQIRAMNPKPGAEFDAVAVHRPREPDLLARPTPDGGWEVSLNRSVLPSLGIAPPAKGQPGNLAAAQSIARMVQARNDTLLSVGQEILTRQAAALQSGPLALRPMTMAEVAQALGLHESTVSRVVAGASVDTPHGMWWLRALFSRGLGPAQVAAAALRERLMRLVSAENRLKPLSDEALARALSSDGAEVARRTVAKYREMLRIPPAHRRKQRPGRT